MEIEATQQHERHACTQTRREVCGRWPKATRAVQPPQAGPLNQQPGDHQIEHPGAR
jgi:hypothetical protein